MNNCAKQLLALAAAILLLAPAAPGQTPKPTTGSWGDQGNGTYRNPVLNADYSDPDVVQVGADFYMVCSDFHFMGIPVR